MEDEEFNYFAFCIPFPWFWFLFVLVSETPFKNWISHSRFLWLLLFSWSKQSFSLYKIKSCLTHVESDSNISVWGRWKTGWKVKGLLGQWQNLGFPGAAAGVPLNQWPCSRGGKRPSKEKLIGLPKWGDLNAHSESQKVQATRINEEESFSG